jgi:hypothetical protein
LDAEFQVKGKKSNIEENQTFKKLMNDSNIIIQIFIDLYKFIAYQSINDE